jgi:glycine cleavage system H protein
MPRPDLLTARTMAIVQDRNYPEHLFYDTNNQIWYEPLADGNLRVGFTPWATSMMGEVLVFTPKRLGRDFEKERSFAVVEGGKWVGSARAAFDGTVVQQNELLIRKPELLNEDAFGQGWMLIVRPTVETWRVNLVTGPAIAPAFEAWLATGAYEDRT